MLEGLGERGKKSPLGTVLKKLEPRWFVVRDARDGRGPTLLQPRWAMSYLRGPMTREQIRRARTDASSVASAAAAPSPPISASPSCVPAFLRGIPDPNDHAQAAE